MKEKLFEALSDEALEKVTGGAGGSVKGNRILVVGTGGVCESHYYAAADPRRDRCGGFATEVVYVTRVSFGIVTCFREWFDATEEGWTSERIKGGEMNLSETEFNRRYPLVLVFQS